MEKYSMIARIALCVGAVVALSLGAALPASAEVADPHASCTGLAISDHAVHDDPGTIAVFQDRGRAAADAYGFANIGQITSRYSQLHLGSHIPACEEATLEILTEGP